MKNIKTQHLINLARYSFSLSFILGTLIFLIGLTIPHPSNDPYRIYIIGLIYVWIAFIINSLIFIGLLIMAIIKKQDRKVILINACIMLINIPIVFIYLLIIF